MATTPVFFIGNPMYLRAFSSHRVGTEQNTEGIYHSHKQVMVKYAKKQL